MSPRYGRGNEVRAKTNPIVGITDQPESRQEVIRLFTDDVWLPRLTPPLPTGRSAGFQCRYFTRS